MATPSRATIQTEWSNAIKILDETRKYGHQNSTNLLGLIDTLQLSYQGDFLDDAEAAVEAIRSNIAASTNSSIAAAIQRPFLREYCKSVIGRTDLASDDEMWDEVIRYMRANSLYVQSRVFTYGSPSAGGSNVGTTQIIRLNKDEYNFDIESQYPDSKRALCIADHNVQGSKGQELWQIKGGASFRDDIKRSGSGQEAIIQGASADDSLLSNASWSSFDSASSPTTITDWTSTTTISSSLCTFDSTNYFRAAPSDGSTPYAINVKLSTTLSQKLTVRGTKLRNDRPYLLAVAWNRSVGSASGTLTLRMGSKFATVTVAAQSGWQITTVPSTVGQGQWYRNFAEDDLDIAIEWSRTSGDLLIDDVLFIEGVPFDNSFYWIIPSSAAYTAPRVNDEFTWTDICTDSILQRWFWRGFNRYVPHSNGSSISWSEP